MLKWWINSKASIIKLTLGTLTYGGKVLPPICKINYRYVNMHNDYLYMWLNYVNLQNSYVDMQCDYVNSWDDYVNMRLRYVVMLYVNIIMLHVWIYKSHVNIFYVIYLSCRGSSMPPNYTCNKSNSYILKHPFTTSLATSRLQLKHFLCIYYFKCHFHN